MGLLGQGFVAALGARRLLLQLPWQLSRSAKISSRSMISTSRLGSTLLDTWITLSSSKQRTTWAMASVSRMLGRGNRGCPGPHPWRRARHQAGDVDKFHGGRQYALGLDDLGQGVQALSGIGTMPLFGLRWCRTGRLSAAIPDLVRALNR